MSRPIGSNKSKLSNSRRELHIELKTTSALHKKYMESCNFEIYLNHYINTNNINHNEIKDVYYYENNKKISLIKN